MNPDLAELTAKVDRVLALLEQQPKPHLTRIEFGRLAGMSRWTVAEKISRRLIRTEKGRIPWTELAKFTSQPNTE